MKIQRGIVKYKDRNDIVCTYALTDDGKQYYFLDENDEKKFTNGNRIATTSLVEAVDPMVKSANVGVIDSTGMIVIPFENRSIKLVNDNIIVVEKAYPTSENVLHAIEMRNDPSSATVLVSTPATIKDKINAQMGVEGKYLFNDQFSEATICDVNGTNLVNGETFSFISQANDKLYMSKNTADSPVSEFSLLTYEYTALPAANVAAPVEAAPAEAAPVEAVPAEAPIDVSTTVVDQQVVEDALNAQAMPPVDIQSPVEGDQAAPADAVPAEATEEKHLIMTYNDSLSTVQDQPAEDTTTAVDGVAPVEGVATDALTPTVDGVMPEETTADVNSVATTVDFPVAGDETVEAAPVAAAPVTTEFSAADNSISDDLKAFANGFASDEEEAAEETDEKTAIEEDAITSEDGKDASTEEDVDSVKAEEDVTDEATDEENEVPPVVEEDNKNTEETEEVVEDEVDETVDEGDKDVEETFSDIVNHTEEDEEEDKSPVSIDAETVLATVDRNNNGIIDSDEIMVPQHKSSVSVPEKAHDSLLDVYGQKESAPLTTNYDYKPSYESTSFDTGLDHLFAETKTGFDSYTSTGHDNIMADVARSMSELMRLNKEQRAAITQYQDKLQSLESQNRILSEKYKDQSARYDSLTDKLRSVDEAAGRVESRNQLLESRIRDQEKIIASQERELKVLRPQVEGKQDLVRLLADARTLLGSETSYGGYHETDDYYHRRAA